MIIRDPNEFGDRMCSWAAIFVFLLLVYTFAAFAHLVPWW